MRRWRSQRSASTASVDRGVRKGRREERAAVVRVAAMVYIAAVVRGMARSVVTRK